MMGTAPGFRDARRGAVALMTALMMPVLIAAMALAVDLGLWYREIARLQIAADAAAMGAARLLPYDNGTGTGTQLADYRTVAWQEALAATGAGFLLGSVTSTGIGGLGLTVAGDKSSVAVTLSSNADLFFASYFIAAAPFRTGAVAGRPKQSACVMALGFQNLLSAVAQAYVNIQSNGQLNANACLVLENPVVPLGVGVKVASGGGLNAFSVGAVGQAGFDPGSAVALAGKLLQPTTPAQDPFSAVATNLTAPACGTVRANTVVICPGSLTQTQYVVPKGAVFTPGTTYYVEGMDLVFDGAALGAGLVAASNVTFVLTSSALINLPLGLTIPGRNPGSLVLRNNANVALAAGTVAGVAVYQACAPLGLLTAPPVNQVQAGSTLTLSGAIYAPCGQLNVAGTITTAIGASSSSLVVGAIDVAAGGRVSLANGVGGAPSSPSQVTLLQ